MTELRITAEMTNAFAEKVKKLKQEIGPTLDLANFPATLYEAMWNARPEPVVTEEQIKALADVIENVAKAYAHPLSDFKVIRFQAERDAGIYLRSLK